MKSALSGVFTAMVTPFDSAQSVDLRWMRQHLEFLRLGGVDGIVSCGTNGEGHSLSLSERCAIVDFLCAHRKKLKLIVSAGFPSLTETLEFAQFCDSRRVDALLITPPYFDPQPSEDGLAAWFEYLAQRVRTPIFLYNIPQMTGIVITPSLWRRLSRFTQIIGVKDSTGDIASTRAFIESAPNKLIFVGHDKCSAAALHSGASGVITGLSNVFPAQVVQIWRDFRSGKSADQSQELVSALMDAFDGLPPRAATKYALHLCGMPRTHVRPPAIELTPQQEETLRKRLTV